MHLIFVKTGFERLFWIIKRHASTSSKHNSTYHHHNKKPAASPLRAFSLALSGHKVQGLTRAQLKGPKALLPLAALALGLMVNLRYSIGLAGLVCVTMR